MERLPPLPPSALGFFFARSAELFWPLRRSPRAETDADDDRLDDGYRHCRIGLLPVQPDRLVGAGAAGVPASGSGIRRRRRMGRRGAARWRMPTGKKPLQQRGAGWAASASCSTGLVSLISSLTSDQQFLSWGWRVPFLFSVVLVLIALWIRNGMAESQEFEAQQSRQRAADEKAATGSGSAASPSGSVLLIIALRLCELLTMYIVTAFALNYSTQNLGLPRELFLNIGLLVGGLSCLTIPCFAGWRPLWPSADLSPGR